MRLLAPLLFCMIGAAAGAVLATLFGARGTGARGGAIAGLVGGFAGYFVRDALDLDLGGPLLGTLVAIVAGALVLALAANLLALARRRDGGDRGSRDIRRR